MGESQRSFFGKKAMEDRFRVSGPSESIKPQLLEPAAPAVRNPPPPPPRPSRPYHPVSSGSLPTDPAGLSSLHPPLALALFPTGTGWRGAGGGATQRCTPEGVHQNRGAWPGWRLGLHGDGERWVLESRFVCQFSPRATVCCAGVCGAGPAGFTASPAKPH